MKTDIEFGDIMNIKEKLNQLLIVLKEDTVNFLFFLIRKKILKNLSWSYDDKIYG